MKQVVLRGGATTVADIPAPSPTPGRVLVANGASVVSSGTERSALHSGGGSLAQRALRNPALVRKTLDRVREQGLRDTVEMVRGKIGDDTALGYSSAGVVLDNGGIADFRAGDRVACAGAGLANHAELVSVPGNLVAPVPDAVSLRDAAFTTVGAIALQGVRRAQPTLGERAVVVGLGLLGLLTVQIARAAGLQVLGIEPVESRRRLAVELGAELALEPSAGPAAVETWSGGAGADVIIVTASSASDAIVNQAIEMVRRKGRVVPVGDVGLSLARPALYQREADILISTSYGPGRYDASYEEGGIDYPLPYVRWTENRNMEEFLRLVAGGQVRVDAIAEVEVPVDDAPSAYAAVGGEDPPLAAVLTYDVERNASSAAETTLRTPRRRPRVPGSRGSATGAKLGVAVIGPGEFIRGVHLPTLRADGAAEIRLVAARSGTRASDVARAAGGARATTDWRTALTDDDVDLLIVGTRHDTHAEIAAAGLAAGKAVFVEKPLGLTREEIDSVVNAAREAGNDRLAIGFNRTFAPLARRLRAEVGAAAGPIHAIYRVNAPLPASHWLNDPEQGGGRILGEGCHMLDFNNWLCGPPVRVSAAALPPPEAVETIASASITVEHSDGSVSTVHYSGVGGKSMPKERVEVLRGGRSWVLEDFRSLTSFADAASTAGGDTVDKGHRPMLTGILDAVRSGAALEPGLDAAYAAQSVALEALASIAASGEARAVPLAGNLAPAGEQPVAAQS